ncbi:MAG: histidine phosphatase family protein [Frankiales bacterium]|nr:histidine phosphatase family protein [Frankiales bacterium]
MTEPTRRLVLVRHAKAADADRDINRPLSTRGLRDARELGRWLSARTITPDVALVSPARRARETWDAISSRVGDVPVQVEDAIYDNTVDAVLAVIRSAPSDAEVVAVVGHNPAISAVAHVLDDGGGDANARADLARGFSTNAVAVFAVAQSWADLKDGGATLIAFATPRDAG